MSGRFISLILYLHGHESFVMVGSHGATASIACNSISGVGPITAQPEEEVGGA